MNHAILGKEKNLYTSGDPEERRKVTEHLFKEIMAKDFTNLTET